MKMDASTIISLLSLVLSLSLAAFYLSDRARAKFALENDYANSLLAWHHEVVDLLIRLRCVDPTPQDSQRLIELSHLSALIEEGRFFFPNIIKSDGFGAEKPPAYRGYRNLALDFLVASYNLLSDALTQESREKLEILQRHFTSIVFEIVRPKERLETIRRLTDCYFTKDDSFESFLSHRDGSLVSHIWRDDAVDL